MTRFAELAEFAEHFVRSPYEKDLSWGFSKQPSELCELCVRAQAKERAAPKFMPARPHR
jgi:hypothetical protein